MERHVASLAIALAARGHDVTVFTEMPLERGNPYGRQLRAAGIRVVTPRALVARSANDAASPALRSIMARGEHNRRTRSLFRSLEDACARQLPDVVHVHGCRLGQQWATQWAAAHRIPAVYTEHTTLGDWGGPHDADAPWAVWSSAGALACVSERSRDSLAAVLPARAAIHVARHIVDPPQGVVPEPCALLCVARLSTHKGIDVLFDALAILQREGLTLPLTIAGAGDARRTLEAHAFRVGIAASVRFLGQVSAVRAAALWAGCRIAVLPSRTEGLPLSLVEGMSHGRPIVASNVGGIPEIIRNGETGLLVPPDDPAALAAALRLLAESLELCARLGANAQAAWQAGGWTESEVVAQTLAIYDEARQSKQDAFDRGRALIRAREAVRDWPSVYLAAWGMASNGESERRIVALAEALRWAGVAVTIFLDSPIRPANRHVRILRRAGVRVLSPNPAAFFLRGRIVRLLRRAAAANRPAVIHLWYWSSAPPWPARAHLNSFAGEQGLPVAETDLDSLDSASLPHDIERARALLGYAPADPVQARLQFESDGSRELLIVADAASLYRRSADARR